MDDSFLNRLEREERAGGVLCSPLLDCIAELRATRAQLRECREVLAKYASKKNWAFILNADGYRFKGPQPWREPEELLARIDSGVSHATSDE